MTARADDATPLELWQVLEEEYTAQGGQLTPEYQTLRRDYLERRKVATEACLRAPDAPECKAALAQKEDAGRTLLNSLSGLLHQARRSALCFSGGGIRSATFGLGVLQGLAQRSRTTPNQPPGLLGEFNYLSTVSGGGYLGSWFSAWAKWHPKSVAGVIEDLSAPPQNKVDPEPPALQHLRSFSNYMDPKLGLLSADTWSLATTMLRNMVLNWFVILPLLVAALAIPRLWLSLVSASSSCGTGWLETPLWAGLAFSAIAICFFAYNLPTFGNLRGSQRAFLWTVLLPFCLSAALLTLGFAWRVNSGCGFPAWPDVVKFGVAATIVGTVAGTVLAFWRRRISTAQIGAALGKALGSLVAAGLTGAAAALMAFAIAARFYDPSLGRIRNIAVYACFAFPAVVAIFMLAGILLFGLASKLTDEQDREWWSRCNAWLMIVVATWLVPTVLVVLGPPLFLVLDTQLKLAIASAGGLGGFLASRLALSTGASAPAGTSNETSLGDLKGSAFFKELAVRLAAPAFLALFVVLISSAIHRLADAIPAWLGDVAWVHIPGVPELLVIAAALVAAGLWSLTIDANKFSLHGMYRDRLVRAYLGASHPGRNPNPFTGFDPEDDFPVHELRSEKPLHVLNMCLNLVGGSNLAWQERKAESFTVSRLHAGSFRVGYRPAALYGSRSGISLGTSVAISGAAASPNMGYHSSPLVTLMMTLFNARLGWWLGNPGVSGNKTWHSAGPKWAARAFVDEALGLTTDQSDWIYLSDGGHFENLALYEMVLRRCHLIVVSDAGADPDYIFEDLGNAVEKIRVDLGIPIHFPMEIAISSARGESNKHCAIGRIFYSAVDSGAEDGVLIYLKPCLNRNEPPDVMNYASEDPSFPQQPTSDQWFDEGQFESYRQLGWHAVSEIAGFGQGTMTLAEFAARAQQYVNLAPPATPKL